MRTFSISNSELTDATTNNNKSTKENKAMANTNFTTSNNTNNSTQIKENRTMTVRELELATKTYAPAIELPDEFKVIIEKSVNKYVNTHILRAMDNEVIGDTEEFKSLIRNRMTNLAIEGINNGTITEAKQCASLSGLNIQMTPDEERAIIIATQEGLPVAINYVYAFFSFKITKYLESNNWNNNHMTCEYIRTLLAGLPTVVREFDLDNVSGGLNSTFCNQHLGNYLKEMYIIPNGVVNFTSRRGYDTQTILRKCITPEDRKLSYAEIAKKYSTSSYPISVHMVQIFFDTEHLASLNQPVGNDDESDSTVCLSDVVACASNALDEIEIRISIDQDCQRLLGITYEDGQVIASEITECLIRDSKQKISNRILKEVSKKTGYSVDTINKYFDIVRDIRTM